MNTHIGVCTCLKGQEGSLYSRQAGMVMNCEEKSFNYIATMSASARMNIATLAINEGAVQDLPFYSSLHQKERNEQYGSQQNRVFAKEQARQLPSYGPSLNVTKWDALRAGATESDNDDFKHKKEVDEYLILCNMIDSMSEVMTEMLESLKSHPV